MAFDPWKYPITFLPPAYCSMQSSWVAHIPFAFAITAMARPRVLVELGTHNGDSYLAFCQAVKVLGLPTRCTAVDTWQGDAHAGFYGENVFANVRAAHDQHYAGFSQLMRMEFDTAVRSFEEGTIDLLHIDGLHTYEAVRHDYETWLPKLSPRAVVLFHDTAMTGHDFGVDRFFAELGPKHPSFGFVHGCGLGVVAPGASPPEPVMEFLEFAAGHRAEIEKYFAALGNRVEMGRMLMRVIAMAAEAQKPINLARRKLNLSVDPKSDSLDTAMQHPIEFVDHLNKTLIDLLGRMGALGAEGGKPASA